MSFLKSEPSDQAQDPKIVELPIRYGDRDENGCDYQQCDQREAYRCLYRDRRGVDCHWAACTQHLRVVQQRAYCLRHASIADVLALAAEQGILVAPPDLDNRAAALVLAVARDLNEPVVERLLRWGDSGMSVVNDPIVRYSRPDRRMRRSGHWERMWALANSTGITLRVSVLVEDDHPETVVLTGGATRLMESVPPWVGRHLRGASGEGSQSDLAERVTFQEQLVTVLDKYVERYGLGLPQLVLTLEP